jgi:hypothetical protein
MNQDFKLLLASCLGLCLGIFLSILNLGWTPKKVYYPNWDGDTMYVNKQDVIQLAKTEGRDSTEIDSAYVRGPQIFEKRAD